MGALTVLLTALCACRHGSSVGTRTEVLTSESIHDISAHDVISRAHLDDTLRYHLDRVGVGEADGKSILADYVTVQNGGEIAAFIRKHGYQANALPGHLRQPFLKLSFLKDENDGAYLILQAAPARRRDGYFPSHLLCGR